MSFFQGVLTGLDLLEEMNFSPLSGKRIAVLTNHTAVTRDGTHLVDLLARRKDIDFKVLFLPQHGFYADGNPTMTVVPAWGKAISLWGERFGPGEKDLEGVDAVVVDLQDTGLRFTTYLTTVTKLMEAAAERDIAVWILDRPNPLGGAVVEGPMVRPQFQSLVGYHLLPIRHGMTLGELAILVNEMGWIRESHRANLTVIPVANWTRSSTAAETELAWCRPVPGVESFDRLSLMEGAGLLEGTNLSWGEGTGSTWVLVGAPWVEGSGLAKSLQARGLEGVDVEAVRFVPACPKGERSGLVPRFCGEPCGGIRLTVIDQKRFSPLETFATVLSVISNQYPRQFRWAEGNYIDHLYGHDYLRIFLAQKRNPEQLSSSWTAELNAFFELRQKFLIYP